jgi:SAM-dependent methyltransferase
MSATLGSLAKRIRDVFSKGPRLALHRLESLEAYRAFVARPGDGDGTFEAGLAARHPDREFTVPGHCWVDDAPVEFRMDYLFADDLGDRRIPNWRERMACPVCGMNNRQRAGLHVATQALRLHGRSRVYITEQVSSGYAAMAARHPLLIGSEFVGSGIAPGSIGESGVRHEDLMRLSMPDRSVDAILTFDVLEHVPDYQRALSECHRVLAPGGALLFSIPFMQDTRETRTRARFDASGQLVHLLPAAYHGDPLRPEAGVLCFHDFGWDILDAARAVGFSSAAALAYHSLEFGYLGGWQLLFEARKRPR